MCKLDFFERQDRSNLIEQHHIRPAVTALWLAVLLTGPATLLAAGEELHIPRLSRAPALEDFLTMQPSEPFRGTMTRVDGGFIQQDPVEGDPASQHTDVYLGYDDRNLYVVFVAFDDEPGKIRANLSRRESIFGDDLIEIQIDTFLDHRKAYTFLANPLGVQLDAIWNEGSRFDSSFDTVWQSRGAITDQGYVVWLAIPFKSLRFPATVEQRWGFFLVRDIPRNNESSAYPAITRKIQSRLAQEGVLTGIEGISPGRNAQINPYVSGRSFRLADSDDAVQGDFLRDEEIDGGLDAKLVLKDAFVFDLTINPDFSQIESDQPQITVNERFELFFPEKRPFFLENSDSFRTPLNLLFTRRIADPLAGIRMTGKSGPHNLGVLLIDDEAPGKQAATGDPLEGKSATSGAIRYSRDIYTQSRVGGIYTERRLGEGHNRVAGLDALLRLGPNWTLSAQTVHSDTLEQDGSSLTGAANDLRVDGSSRRFSSHSHYSDAGKDFRTDLGFIPRTDMRDLHQRLAWTFWPEGEKLISWTPSLFARRVEDTSGVRLDRSLQPQIEFRFRHQTSLEVSSRRGRERLRAEDHPELAASRDYETGQDRVEFDSRISNALDIEISLLTGRVVNFSPPAGTEPELADISGVQAEITLRPTSALRVDLSFVSRNLDQVGTGNSILKNRITRLRCNWQFSRRASLRAIVQHDSLTTNPLLTSTAENRNLNGDILFTWLQNPWTAFYAGFNSNYTNMMFTGTEPDRELVLTDSLDLNDGRQLFVKYSYLHRF